MPTVAQGPSGIRIEQRYKEHHPPHFHAIQGSDKVSIRIADFGVEAGGLNQIAMTAVVSWAAVHQMELALNWVLAHHHMQVRPISWP